MPGSLSCPHTKNVARWADPLGRLADDRVELRLPDPTDPAVLHACASEEGGLLGVWAPLAEGAPLHSCEELLGDWLAGWRNLPSVHGPAFVITQAGHPKLIGQVGLGDRGDKVVELVYGIGPDHRGRGYAARALRLAARWLRDEGSADQIELRIAVSHLESQRVAVAAGFTLAGGRIARPSYREHLQRPSLRDAPKFTRMAQPSRLAGDVFDTGRATSRPSPCAPRRFTTVTSTGEGSAQSAHAEISRDVRSFLTVAAVGTVEEIRTERHRLGDHGEPAVRCLSFWGRAAIDGIADLERAVNGLDDVHKGRSQTPDLTLAYLEERAVSEPAQNGAETALRRCAVDLLRQSYMPPERRRMEWIPGVEIMYNAALGTDKPWVWVVNEVGLVSTWAMADFSERSGMPILGLIQDVALIVEANPNLIL